VRVFDILGALGLCLAMTTSAAGAQGSLVADEQARSRLSVLSDPDTARAAPQVLRGSAIARRAPDPAPVTGPARFSLQAGKRLWLTDPESREVIACALYNTSEVGVRVVRCYEGDLPRSVARY
jgi:hypothetical protein